MTYKLLSGQLAVLLNHLEARGGPHVSKEILDQIQVIHDKADHVSNLATPIVRESQATYYNSKYSTFWFIQLIHSKFILFPMLLAALAHLNTISQGHI